jgi:hypothetical protein
MLIKFYTIFEKERICISFFIYKLIKDLFYLLNHLCLLLGGIFLPPGFLLLKTTYSS